MNITLSQVADIVGGQLHCADGAPDTVCSISTDTRCLECGALYVALRGAQFDGDAFVAQAQEQGAVAAVVHQRQPISLAQIVVDDTRKALADLARWQRRHGKATVFALTGSNGKTTTKELLHRLLAERGNVLATEGNLNNDIGVPLTLLRLTGDEDFAVIEMGANHEGEIAELVGIAEPDVVMVTNVSAAHLEGFGSLEGVVRAKGEIYAASGRAKVVLNLDLDCAPLWQGQYSARIAGTFALHHDAEVTAKNISADGRSFTLCNGQDEVTITWQLAGLHNVANALAAFAAASVCGLNVADAAQAWQGLRLTQSRLSAYEYSGNTVYDDTYNANPASFKAGIDVIAAQHPCLVVAGAMGELGHAAAQLHRDVAAYARRRGIDGFWCVGDAARVYGDEDGFIRHFSGARSAADALKIWLQEQTGGAVLVKGSRSARMEQVIEHAGIKYAG